MTIAERLREVAVSESGFLFDPLTGLTFGVNPTGRFLLERMREGAGSAEAVAALREAFDTADRDDLDRDVAEFVRLLKDQGLLPRDAELP